MADAREEAENNRALRECAAMPIPVVTETVSGIRCPLIQANNFQIKPDDKPNTQSANFLKIYDAFK
ncbi:hypothetical protein TIFTF001_031818 [Ficus carica]|uniref:Uncharacterized protein n=1 Tax=Ficus carica TaxID=3494 RepID=A0AA88DVT5_FICCA|nr:hypothetical protein TIFTF001_031818 [Ficus carica]